MTNKNIIEEKSINENNLEILKRYFPNAIRLDDDGRYNIDTTALQLAIDPTKAKLDEDGYSLNWVGKREAYSNAYTKNQKILKPLKEDSKDWDKSENILIKGDNLDVLKILRNNYYEKIKMIYIDPPYNTKNDNFIYKDDFTNSELEILEELGYDSKDKIDYIKNIYGAKTHSGWLSFMFPRLLLAKDLLKDDGVIFISIDDNEVANLRLLCDEVFGEGNFVGEIIWHSKYTTSNDAKYLSTQHEIILFYAKNKDNFNIGLLDRQEKQNKDYKNRDNDLKGEWKPTPIHAKSGTENNLYTIKFPNGIEWKAPKGRYPRYSKERLLKLFNDNELYFNSNGGIDKKTYLSEVKQGITAGTVWSYEEVGHTHFNNEELASILGKGIFDNPKGTKLIKRMFKVANINTSDIILDFFAGSGTTGDAVMQLNAQDGGNRKYILVQIPESIDKKQNKTSYDFVKNELQKEPTIFEITAERLRRAGEKIKKESLTNQDLDIGFRVFEVIEDEKQSIYHKSLLEVNQKDLDIFENQNEEIETILYNLLVAENLLLSSKIAELIKDKFYKVDNIGFILDSFNFEEQKEYLRNLEYLTIYSPNIKDDKFTLELQSFMDSLGMKKDKLKFKV